MSNSLYTLSAVSKCICTPEGEDVCIISDATCSIARGTSISIMGASGSGKSTLLHLLGALDMPTSGTITYNGEDITHFSREDKAIFHRKEVGFIFQFHHLLPEFTTLENVALHAQLAGYGPAESNDMAYRALNDVGIVEKAHERVTVLSGGEKQRASIARAIVTSPSVLLADEPTGSLDIASAEHITELLQSLHMSKGTTLILVTHNIQLASRMQEHFVLDMGVLRHA